ncbi:Hsp70 family protein [Intestinibacter bartlettii]|uniref:Hsp70 family protein n=1 Tax=Intestinibacter bartlettii TaxID=261299 RepID=UPI0022E78421|nr:Hsp70 family protein [Intestinibacter bartlettii]
MAIYCGIDLGTTNSTVSVIQVDGYTFEEPIDILKTIPIYQLDRHKNVMKDKISLPSSIYFDLDNNNIYTGVYAKDVYGSGNKPMQTIRSIKTRMGGESLVEIPYIKSDKSVYFNMTQCSALFLKTIKKSIELQFENEEVKGAVVTVPAAFNIDERQATRNAMLLAGFEEVYILDEPTAALLYYANDSYNKPGGLEVSENEEVYRMVYDIGGGTTDVSIARMMLDEEDNLDLKIVGRSPRMDLGGDDFDQYLASYFLSRFEQGEEDIHDLSVPDQNRMISRIVYNAEREKININEKIKENLGNERKLKRLKNYVSFEIINGKYLVDVELSKEKLNNIFYDLVSTSEAKVLKAVKDALRDAELRKEDISEVILTGGMSNFYIIEETLKNYFGENTRFILIDTESAVSKGAAIYHYQQEYESGIKLKVEDKLSDDIFIKDGNEFYILISRTAKPGDSGSFEYEIKEDNLCNIDIFLYYGRGNNPENYTPISGKFAELKNLKSKGDKLKINWELDEDKIIKIFIEELGEKIEINSSNDYSEDKIKNNIIQNLCINGDEI